MRIPPLERRGARPDRLSPLARLRRALASLVLRTVALLVVATVLPLAVSVVETWMGAQREARYAIQQASRVTGLAADEVSASLEQMESIASSLGPLAAFWEGDDATRDRLLQAFASQHPVYSGLLFATPDLQEHGRSSYQPGSARMDLSSRAYAREALATDSTAFADQGVRPLDGRDTLILPLAIPVHRAGAPGEGLLVAGLLLDQLPTLWASVPLPSGSSVRLINRATGLLVGGSADVRASVDQPVEAPVVEAIRAGEQGSQVVSGPGGDQLLTWDAVDGTLWVVAASVPAATVLGPIYAEAVRRILLSLAVALLAFSLLLVLWRQLSSRLDALQAAAAAWGRGEWSQRVGIRGADELGQLGLTFDRMADQLQSTVEQLEAAAQRATDLAAVAEEREARVRAVLDNVVDGIVTFDQHGLIESFNPAAERIFGFTRDEVLGKKLVLLMAQAGLAEASADGSMTDMGQAVGRRKDGTTFPMDLRFSELHLGDQRLFIAILRDVTDRRRVQQELQQQRDFAQQVMSTMGQGLTVTNEHGRFEYVNEAYARMLGYKPEELIGKKPTDVTAVEDTRVLEAARAQRRAGETTTYETRFHAADGREVFGLITGTPRLRDGQVAGSIAVVTDLTERKRAEEALERLRRHTQLILESAGEGIVGLDQFGHVTFVNPAAAAMLVYGPDELLGQGLHELIHHRGSDGTPFPAHACPTSATLKQGIVTRDAHAHFWRKDGTWFPADFVSTPIREQGEVVGAVVTFRDVTERRVVEKMKDEFVSVVSHELRTPLTSIRGSLGLLAGGLLGPLPDRGQRMLDIAVANTDRLIRLINDILDIERMESGKVSLERRPCDGGELMHAAAEALQGLAEKAGVQLEVVPPGAPLPLWADADRVVQVLTNLLSNAVKFSPTGGTVRLSATLAPPAEAGKEAPRGEGQGQVRFDVQDSGRGVPPEKHEAIFGRFQQVDASDSREKGGTGLGLAICRTIVQQHGGTIWVESDGAGHGSTFSFTLPVLASAGAGADASQGLPAVTPDRAPTVLVCDDDPSMREAVGELLAEKGYRVVLAKSGAETLDQARLEPHPDAILLDLLMPGLSGWETLAALKAQEGTRGIPVVIFSALQPTGAPDQPPDAPPRGEVAAWVTKPFEESTLFQALERALSGEPSVSRVLLVEDDGDLARVLSAMFERHGIEVYHAGTGRQAIHLSQEVLPDVIVLDLGVPEGDGFAVVDWLRQHDRLHLAPLVVYTARDLTEADRARLTLGETAFLTKSRIPPEELEQRIVALLRRIIPGTGAAADGGATSAERRTIQTARAN